MWGAPLDPTASRLAVFPSSACPPLQRGAAMPHSSASLPLTRAPAPARPPRPHRSTPQAMANTSRKSGVVDLHIT